MTAHTILYNALKWAECKDDEIQAVLKYMQTGLAESSLVRDIEAAIESERELQSMRDEYMTYDMKLCEVRDETREQTWGEVWGQASYEKAMQTARAFLAMGLSAQQVAQGTGLPVEEVETLR